jgi:putative tricarboxylic transport membrane protein
MGFIELVGMGAAELFQFEPLLMMVFGMVIGIVFGALPGFSSSNTAALMLPLTLGMGTTGAIIFIGGIYCGVQYGGGVPAILIGTPGTAGAVATVFDGYAMAKQGMADRALGLSLGASAVGSIIGSIISLFIIQPIAAIALSFGPAETALLAVLGLSFIVSIVGKDIRKGILAVLFGLLASFMSADPNMGLPRLNFGFYEIYDSVPFTPLIMGLFGFPAMMDIISEMKNDTNLQTFQVGTDVMGGVIESIRRPFLVVYTSLIGLFVGIVPGAGINIGSFMAYSQAKSLSKHPETFGKGNPEGIIAAEAANNGVASGALVPSVSLGIPGAATAAVLLATLTLHGVIIGPQIIRNHPGPVYALMLAMIACGFLTFPMGYLFNKVAVKIMAIKRAFIVPAVFVLCIAGSYADRKFIFDMYLCLIAGVIGILMAKGHYPMGPFILAFVLGPLMEQNFVRAILISRGSYAIFFHSPICKIMWLIIVSSFLAPFLIKFFQKARKAKA